MKYTLMTMTILIMGVFAVPVRPAVPSTWYVNGASGSDSHNCKSSTTACKTVWHAISLASAGDSIIVAAATYTENLTISKSLNVIGSGASTTYIDGGGAGTVVTISNATAHVTLSKLTITNGRATRGGGINNSGTLTLTNSTVSGNVAPIPYNCFPPFDSVCGYWGIAAGGGISNYGALIISNSIISENRAGGFCELSPYARTSLGCSADGGGIYNADTLTINSSTLTGNRAEAGCSPGRGCGEGGGGALATVRGTVALNNSTVEGNYANQGGGIVNSSYLAMNNGTVSGNSGGGIFNEGTATLQNSIIANNSGTNCSGTITSHGYNLSSDGTCQFESRGDLNNHDPRLGSLQNNGGPTPTMALQSGSLAIDGGNPGGCTDGQGYLLKTDQRGMSRPDREDKGGCDIGAYERQGD